MYFFKCPVKRGKIGKSGPHGNLQDRKRGIFQQLRGLRNTKGSYIFRE